MPQAIGTFEVVAAPTPADPNQARGRIALVTAAGLPALPARGAVAVADLPATGNTADTVAVKVNALLAALRTTGAIKS